MGGVLQNLQFSQQGTHRIVQQRLGNETNVQHKQAWTLLFKTNKTKHNHPPKHPKLFCYNLLSDFCSVCISYLIMLRISFFLILMLRLVLNLPVLVVNHGAITNCPLQVGKEGVAVRMLGCQLWETFLPYYCCVGEGIALHFQLAC